MTSLLQPHSEGQNGTYTFSSRPRPVPNRHKYRDPGVTQNEGPPFYGNIMYDRRVVRGNTYAQNVLPVIPPPTPIELQQELEARKRAASRKLANEQYHLRHLGPLDERKHVHVQTDSYLEELSKIIQEENVECQTDAFLDKPSTPLFVPAKTGQDVATQIEVGELFDFDLEVQPVLEVLVGKTMEQSLLEVLEEEELASLRAQQQAFLELRNAELVEVQRLEEQERRHCEEKARRVKQQREVLQKEKEVAEKIAARTFSHQYLTDLLPSVYSNLRDQGYFYDPVQRDIETGFLPWLTTEVSSSLENRHIAYTVLDMLIQDAMIREVNSQ